MIHEMKEEVLMIQQQDCIFNHCEVKDLQYQQTFGKFLCNSAMNECTGRCSYCTSHPVNRTIKC